MTYSLDFRKKVFAVKAKRDLTFKETSQHFDVDISTLFRWQQKMEPCLTRNKPATKLDMEALARDVESAPDDYQWERAKRLGVAERTIGYGLKRLGVSYTRCPWGKKTLKSSQGRRRRTHSLSKKDWRLGDGRSTNCLS